MCQVNDLMLDVAVRLDKDSAEFTAIADKLVNDRYTSL